MGLLDDAIREHLDLKRARGGDPAEIERMEREALGPVRREPTIGSTRFEPPDEHAQMAPETGYPDDRDELLNAGYHDSTAPHPHSHHEHAHHEHADPYAEHEYDDPFAAEAEEHEQPKRRFLRRNRPSSLPEQAPQEADLHADHDFHEHAEIEPHELLEHEQLPARHEPVEHYQPLEQHEPLEHQDQPPVDHEPVEQHQPLADHQPLEHEAVQPSPHHEDHEQAPSPSTPPHLQFEQPPKRPRFSAEPPSLHPEAADEPPTDSHEPSGDAGTAPAPHSEPEDREQAQETTEFDVQKHIAETRFEPDAETRVHRAPAPPADAAPDEAEDVLEETPEFLQDTPEHDRLWFEQRPPRDFDFDG